MIGYQRLECIDAGNEYAHVICGTDSCIICSHLWEKNFVSAIGMVCVYQDFCWLNEKKKDIRKTIGTDC